jgi:hypothetical protein
MQWGGRRRGRQESCVWAARVLGPLAALCLVLALVLAPTASSLTWDGGAAVDSPGWSSGVNWVGESTPSPSGPVDLEFPHLPSPACTSAPPSDTCYASDNDVGNLEIGSLHVDDGADYELHGDGITLSSTLTASPDSVTNGPAIDDIDLPISLAGSEAWVVAGRAGGAVAEDGISLEKGIDGSQEDLTFNMDEKAALYLRDDIETELVAFGGGGTGVAGDLNGVVDLQEASLNASDGGPVIVGGVLMLGSGSTGPLFAQGAELVVGNGYPAGGIEAKNATFDASSQVEFEISGSGAIADTDYSQLSSAGTIALGGASFGVLVTPTSGTSCPTLAPGQTYTFVSTTGTLSGSFANAPEGTEIPVVYAKSCATHPSTYLRIAYHRSGETQTVTGTTELPEPKTTPESYEKPNAEGAIVGPMSVGQSNAEYLEHQYAVEAAARQREEAERRARIAQQNAATVASPVSFNIVVQRDGTALIKLACSGNAGGSGCAGKLTLSTQAASRGKRRSHTGTVASTGFSIAAGKTTTVPVKLDATGRALLGAAHGHLSAHLTIVQSAPAPAHTRTESVHLLQQRAGNSRDGRSKK